MPDILNIHDIYNIKQILFSLHFFFRGVKVYVSPRGSFSEGALNRSRIKKKFFIFFYRFYALFIHSFIALNEGEKKSIRKIFKNKKIVIIGNGINFSLKRTDDLNHLFIKKNNNKTVNIGFLGRFDIFIKGLDLLLQAYSEYQDDTESPSIRLNLLGAPNHKPKEIDSIEFINNISKNLKNSSLMDVKGPFFGSFKWSELAKLDILILPSRSEGMPNVVLEAMSLGIPCAVTKETNMLDLILDSDSGWKIDLSIESIKNFFHEIQELNSKEDLIQKGENGKNYAKKNLSWDIIAIDNYL
jgi:glycosyltransferase involved in cell wall biosynthesis